MKQRAGMWCSPLVLFLFIIPQCRAATLQYQIEAAFLFNFTQFVDWPATAFDSNNSPLVIGVLGEDPFGSDLDDIVRGEVVNGHPLAVERYRSVQEIHRCHVLFIADSENAAFRSTLLALKHRNVLTVSNLDGFAKAGGVVRFRIADNKLRFRINVNAAHEAQLVISSKLLRQAELVGSTED
ncbi:MAG TPA: YfiR family protein [Steroidobacteraceae bacterium]|nr:YfiR family protein [Steroidobacteraceae bacterium]